MNNRTKLMLLAAVVATVFAGVFASGQLATAKKDVEADAEKIGFTQEFFIEDCDFTDTGSNKFFILEPNYQLVLRGEVDGTDVELTITVLDETREVDGVVTRTVEERHSEDGELLEVSRNYFAICKQTNSVFYFGEEVDFYENGQIVGHQGAWLAGVNGAEAGVMMPGIILLGSKYHQETAPGVAMDRAKIVSMDEEVDTPAGQFDGVVKTRETTPLEKGIVEFKYHAPGVGLISDGELLLEEYGFI
jgi:hypothetical protein